MTWAGSRRRQGETSFNLLLARLGSTRPVTHAKGKLHAPPYGLGYVVSPSPSVSVFVSLSSCVSVSRDLNVSAAVGNALDVSRWMEVRSESSLVLLLFIKKINILLE